MEWVEHGYGIVQLDADKAVFECWWQNKLEDNSPDVLGAQLVSFSANASTQFPVPRFKNQIDTVGVHGLGVMPTQSPRRAALAPMAAVLKPR
ncbi:hypothetical protein NQT62_06800 [Limnobacter humi]|uniref:Uncharacterized protein n=1 Tax=Limnobacter humi TaxID=1778671 RepID=A0ABT1WF58_9BURK|nr:hypothetical protein [Limnobacter humi]MCQ8896145.1 hypothetical protein [Limnobacter humi]